MSETSKKNAQQAAEIRRLLHDLERRRIYVELVNTLCGTFLLLGGATLAALILSGAITLIRNAVI